jgi:hypothetical protein
MPYYVGDALRNHIDDAGDCGEAHEALPENHGRSSCHLLRRPHQSGSRKYQERATGHQRAEVCVLRFEDRRGPSREADWDVQEPGDQNEFLEHSALLRCSCRSGSCESTRGTGLPSLRFLGWRDESAIASIGTTAYLRRLPAQFRILVRLPITPQSAFWSRPPMDRHLRRRRLDSSPAVSGTSPGPSALTAAAHAYIRDVS